MADRGTRLDLENEFPSMALYGEGIPFSTIGTDMYFDVPDVMIGTVLLDPEEQQTAEPEEENPYMSLKNCALDMFKEEMAEMFQTMNIHEITTKVRKTSETAKLKKTSMLMSSIYRRKKSRRDTMDAAESVNMLVVRNLDTCKIAFLKSSKKYQNKLRDALKTHRAEVHWDEAEDDSVKLTEIKSDDRPSSQDEVQLWRDEVDAEFTDFLKRIMVRKVTMIRSVWTKMKESNTLSRFEDLDKDMLIIIASDDLPGVVIVGDMSVVTKVAADVLELVRDAEEQNSKKASIHRVSLHRMEPWKLQYLLDIDIHAKFSAKYQDLEIEINKTLLTVDLSGQGLDITKAKFEIQHILNNVQWKLVENVASYCLQAYTLDEFHDYIVGVLKAKHIEATFQVLSDELWVYSVPTMIEQATKIIRESVKMRYIKTDVLSREMWERVLHFISQTTTDPFYIDFLGEDHKAALIYVPPVEEFVMEKLKEATRDSAMQMQRVQLEKGIFLVLSRRCGAEVEDIKSKFKVDISFDHAYCMVAIRGPTGVVTAALKEVQNLSDRVFQQNLDLTSSGASKFCQSLKGDSAIKEAEEEFQCVMDVKLEGDSLEGQTFKAHINVIKGDISHQLVDVIVNPVPNVHSLDRSRSVYSVLDDAGSLIERHLDGHFSGGLQSGEVAVTSGGNLRCKSIFHCCVPKWSADSSIEDYQELIKQCLDKADVSNYSSIAFPALGCEEGGYPRVTAATALLDAILSYEETTNSGIKLINIVVDAKDSDTYDVFNNERNNRIIGTKHFKEYDDSDDVTSMAAGIRIVVQYGELADTKADALVNTTNQSLELSYGAVSASLLKAAGSGLQKECKIKYPQGLLPGQLAVTLGWKLPCKNIYHCHLPKWVGNKEAKETLERIIDTCLHLASMEAYETLAFPALGTGVLKYPSDVVAAVFKERVALFSQDNPLSCLREIIIVLYHKDDLTCKVFSEVFEDDPDLKEDDKNTTEKKSEEFLVGPVQVSVKRGSLFQEEMDAIVIPTDNKISLSDEYGKSLIRTCGHPLMQESKCVNIKRSGGVLVSAKPLPAKKILFVSTEYFKNDMDGIVQKVFRKASKNKIHSLSIPHINAASDADGSVFAKALATAFTQRKSILKGLININIVMTSQTPMASCISALRGHFRNPSKRRSYVIKEPNAQRRTSVYFTKSEVMSVSDRPHLRMLGMDEESLRQCGEKMKSVISENIADRLIIDRFLEFFTQKEIDKVMVLCKELDVDVEMDIVGRKLQLQGIKTDVDSAHKRIQEIIQKTESREDQKAKARNIEKKVQWYFMSPSNQKLAFTSVSNMCIEKAFTEKMGSFPLHLAGKTVVLNFNDMTISLSPTQTLKLLREAQRRL